MLSSNCLRKNDFYEHSDSQQVANSTFFVSLGTSSTLDRPEDDSEENLWFKWGHIVNDWENNWKKQNAQIRELVRRGVPLHFRAIVWQLLCGANDAPEKKLYADYIKVSGFELPLKLLKIVNSKKYDILFFLND